MIKELQGNDIVTQSTPKEAEEQQLTETGQELFVPIHGHVDLFPEEIAIIDHPAFQRLRRVRQLGMAHMVFPGATHTRFEHSVGAVHVSKLIIDHVNTNCKKAKDDIREWLLVKIDGPTARFIRLAALLHDVGHLPFGHTLEDELNHLHSHDGPERLERVARIRYPNHEVDQAIIPASERPVNGWTLEALVNRLYSVHAKALGIIDVEPFRVLSQIVCKPPRDSVKKTAWMEQAEMLSARVMLDVCRDVVGNTICADFLDYIHRDWYHLGKLLYHDMRIYQYMEVLRPKEGSGQPQFVINVRGAHKIRHDALTDILELLNARYKLAETVLFHRTKLALTGLLDRCILEIKDLYQQVGLTTDKFIADAEELLLNASDDGLPTILKQLAEGGDDPGKQRVTQAIQDERSAIRKQLDESLQKTPTAAGGAGSSKRKPTTSELEHTLTGIAEVQIPETGAIGAQQKLVSQLIEKLRDREVYTLVYKLRMSDFPGPHSPDNARLSKLLTLYNDPKKRMEFLRGMEALCGFPAGTLIMNCPPDARMNAKVAEVRLFVEAEVHAFNEYERKLGDSGLTRGALTAQVNRFYELWAASIYVDRREWDRLSEDQRKHLKSLLQDFFFQKDAETDPKIVRMQAQTSINTLSKKAAQKGTVDPNTEALRDSVFPSGVPFSHPQG